MGSVVICFGFWNTLSVVYPILVTHSGNCNINVFLVLPLQCINVIYNLDGVHLLSKDQLL